MDLLGRCSGLIFFCGHHVNILWAVPSIDYQPILISKPQHHGIHGQVKASPTLGKGENDEEEKEGIEHFTI